MTLNAPLHPPPPPPGSVYALTHLALSPLSYSPSPSPSWPSPPSRPLLEWTCVPPPSPTRLSCVISR